MEYINIGKITSTHGLRGELKLKSSFMYIDRVLKDNFCFYIGDSKTKVNLLKYRCHNGMYLLAFKNYEDINLVEEFRNSDVYVDKSDIALQEDEYLFEDLIGLEAYYNGENIGIIKDITDCGNNNYVFYIEGEKDILIPFNNNFISEIADKKVVFKEVEGLIDAN